MNERVLDAALTPIREGSGLWYWDDDGELFDQFINKLADYTIPVGSAFSVLGLIWGGMLFQAGDQRAGRVLAFVALGVGIVLLSKPVAA